MPKDSSWRRPAQQEGLRAGPHSPCSRRAPYWPRADAGHISPSEGQPSTAGMKVNRDIAVSQFLGEGRDSTHPVFR